MEKTMKKNAPPSAVEQRCVRCDAVLSEENGFKPSKKWLRKQPFFYLCNDCQEAYFGMIAGYTSPALALFYCCVAFNVPFVSESIPPLTGTYKPWSAYKEGLKIALRDISKNGFGDGETDISRIFAEGLSFGRFSRDIANRTNNESAPITVNSAQEKWGLTSTYTQSELEHLDSLYESFAQEYKGAISPRIDLGLREIAKCWYEREKAITNGDTDSMRRLTEVINTTMSSEALKATDSKPTEATRIDAIVDKLEKEGAAFDGRLLGREELGSFLAKWNPKKSRSLDMVDNILLALNNTMRRNMGQSPTNYTPDSLRVEDTFNELEKQLSPEEKKAIKKLGVSEKPEASEAREPVF